MSDLMEYKCPCCGGGIAFDASLQKLKCPYCDTEFEVDTLKLYDDELKNDNTDETVWKKETNDEWTEDELTGLKKYSCNSCGAEIIADETLASTKCPYCDNPIMMVGQFSKDLRPDYIIPFKFDKKAAKEKLAGHLSGKKFLPKVFKDENHIDEIKGVYVPFWLFDSDVNARIRYKATKTRMWSDSKYDYRETSYYNVVRAGKVGFDTIPVDGSSKMDDTLMESIEPFDSKEAVPFQTAYLAGYLSDRYDVDSDESISRANERVRKSAEEKFASTVRGYSTVIPESSNIQILDGKVRYALYPVWILNTNWNGEKYTFAMNGQTGKFVGNLPCDKALATKYMLKLTAIITVVCAVIARVLNLF